jgi:transposase-like protein
MGQPASGLSIREWCARHEVTEASFYAWRRTLGRRGALRSATIKNSRARLVAVEVAGAGNVSAEGPPLQLVMGDVRVEIAPGFDGDTLRRLVSVLREAAAC